MVNKCSIKISEEGKDFLIRFRDNRRKAGMDREDLPFWKLILIMERYFKLHNLEYIDLVNLEETQC